MKTIMILLGIITMILLLSCSGDDPLDTDTEKPNRPKLVAHQGDTGDPPWIINGEPVEVTDENNGTDTVPDGNWIKIVWEPFIDTDLSHVKVYRFTQNQPTPTYLNTIPHTAKYYVDQSQLTEREWYSYFIELYDASGNFSVSDTVKYAILAKCNLYTPEDGAIVSPVGLRLKWYRGDSDASIFRVLVWKKLDESNYKLEYSFDYALGTEDNPLEVLFPNMNPPLSSGDEIRWRVDSFDWDAEQGMYMGSESMERTFFIQ